MNSLADGSPANDGACTLREAIANANADNQSGSTDCAGGAAADTIAFAVSGTITLHADLPIVAGDLSILGDGRITVDGASSYQPFYVQNGTVNLDGLTVTHGSADDGGGIFNDSATVSVTNSTISDNGVGLAAGNGGGGIFNDFAGTLIVTDTSISNNAAGTGGGIHNDGGTVTVTNSTISGNTGGGISNLGTFTVTDSTISGNTASAGGGIYNNGSTAATVTTATVTLTNSTISGNTATVYGGGIHNVAAKATVTVMNSTISGNTAKSGGTLNKGGGIHNNGGTVTLTNSSINANTASESGGGIHNNSGTVTVSNSTISANASLMGGGIYNNGDTAAGVANATVTMTNATISDNVVGHDGGGIYSVAAKATVTVTNSTISDNVASNYAGGINNNEGTLHVRNTIVAGNSVTGPNGGDDVAGSLATDLDNLIGVPAGQTLAGILNPAGLVDNGGPTKTIALTLVVGNPAIDTADSTSCSAPPVNGLDQRGEPRPSGACDIGAYEAQEPWPTPTPTPTPTATPTPTPTATPTPTPTATPTPTPTAPFTDIAGSSFEADITWLYNSGITKGCSATKYCPNDDVTRGQMAAFLDRALDLPATTTDFFTDDETSTFEAAINRLAASGITKGCTATTFCPTGKVTRGQMAAFLDRALDLPATTTDFFTDDETSTFETAINRLAASGITKGCSATKYCPDAEVTRGQMAAFLHRALTRQVARNGADGPDGGG